MGRIDILVNNAGIYEEHKIAEVDYATWQARWQRTIDVNLTGAAKCLLLCRATYDKNRVVGVLSMSHHAARFVANLMHRVMVRAKLA